MMASMKNGGGEGYFLLFNDSGAIGKVFVAGNRLYRNEISQIIKKITSIFQSFKNEEAFNLNEISFCFWRSNNEESWMSEPTSKNLPYLSFLTGDSTLYKAWAEEYYEKEFQLEAIQEIFSHEPLTHQMVSRLNKKINLEDLSEDIYEIGYPTSSS